MTYYVTYNIIKYVYVSPLPTAVEGLTSFLSPFSYTVWLSLIGFCITITLIVRFVGHSAERKLSITKLVEYFVHDFLNLSLLLFGQINGDSFKMFYRKLWVAVPILIVWLLGGGFIIMNNLYMGSIFSYLSAILSPIFPLTWKSLVDSEIPIATTTKYNIFDSANLDESIVKSLLIPEYKRLFRNNPSLMLKFDQLYKKLIFFGDDLSSRQFLKFLRNTEASRIIRNTNESLDTSKTFAIMDFAKYLKVYSNFLQWSGSRLVSIGNEATPFTQIGIGAGSKNFISPIFQSRVGRLTSFGLMDRWNRLDDLYTSINTWYTLDGTISPKYFAKAMSNGKEPVTFHESDPVPLKSLLGALLVCSVFILLSFLCFLKEVGCGVLVNLLILCHLWENFSTGDFKYSILPIRCKVCTNL